MLLNNVKLTIVQLLGTENATLVGMNERTVYRDGEPTEDKITALTVTSPESGYEKITVKVEQKPDFSFTADELTARNVAGNFVKVRFVSDVCKVWTDKAGNAQISAKAQSVELINNDDVEISLT